MSAGLRLLSRGSVITAVIMVEGTDGTPFCDASGCAFNASGGRLEGAITLSSSEEWTVGAWCLLYEEGGVPFSFRVSPLM